MQNTEKSKLTTPNISTEEQKALSTLKQEQSIYIAEVDKSNATVALNWSDYESKVLEHLKMGHMK